MTRNKWSKRFIETFYLIKPEQGGKIVGRLYAASAFVSRACFYLLLLE